MSKHISWLFPLVLLIFLAPFTPQIDLTIERYFFVNNQFQSSHIIQFIYSFGVIPGWLVACSSLLIFILSYLHPYWRAWRPYALVPLLTMVVGAGLIIDKTFKDHWGRPRPRQVKEFGGEQQFRPFYDPNFFHQTEPSKSFPSGHCSMGFLFFSVALMGKRLGKRPFFWAGLTTSLILGALLGYARMAQGGHFFSDIIFSAAIMWWTAYLVDGLIFERVYRETSEKKIT